MPLRASDCHGAGFVFLYSDNSVNLCPWIFLPHGVVVENLAMGGFGQQHPWVHIGLSLHGVI